MQSKSGNIIRSFSKCVPWCMDAISKSLGFSNKPSFCQSTIVDRPIEEPQNLVHLLKLTRLNGSKFYFIVTNALFRRTRRTCVSCYCETNYWFEFYNFPRVNLFFMGVQATLIKSRVLSSVLIIFLFILSATTMQYSSIIFLNGKQLIAVAVACNI